MATKKSAKNCDKLSAVRKGLHSLRTRGPVFTAKKSVGYLRSRLSDKEKESFSSWVRKHEYPDSALEEQRSAVFGRKILFSIIVALYNTPIDYLRDMLDSVIAQSYTGWELCIADGSTDGQETIRSVCEEYIRKNKNIHYKKLDKNLGVAGNTNAALEMATGDYFAVLDHDDILSPAVLYKMMEVISSEDPDVVYTDEATFISPDRHDIKSIHFKPDFAIDNLRANNYICHFTAVRRSLLDTVGLFRSEYDGSQDHDMMLRLSEVTDKFAHVPEVLYFWRAAPGSTALGASEKNYAAAAGRKAVHDHLLSIGIRSEVSSLDSCPTIYRIRYPINGTPKVSIIIQTRDHLRYLDRCLRSIEELTTYENYEIILVENQSRDPKTFAYYDRIIRKWNNIRVIRWEDSWNWSALNNYAVREAAEGDYFLFLNNDTKVITPDWIQEMLMYAQRKDVAAVGAMLYYPNDMVQHAGVIIGLGGVAGHVFHMSLRDNAGYMGRLSYPQDLSAVTGACIMIRRNVWDEIGGMDESFPIGYNDIDFCLRARRKGYQIIWTPYAELYHYESVSRGYDTTQEGKSRLKRENERFTTRWKAELDHGDPFYNPNLSLYHSDFRIKETDSEI